MNKIINEVLTNLNIAQEKTTIQTLIFSKDKFTKQQAKKWAKNHGFKSSNVDETSKSFRLRQKEPTEFKPDSFRTISLADGIKAVIGRPK